MKSFTLIIYHTIGNDNPPSCQKKKKICYYGLHDARVKQLDKEDFCMELQLDQGFLCNRLLMNIQKGAKRK
jgi:hypothetical protein